MTEIKCVDDGESIKVSIKGDSLDSLTLVYHILKVLCKESGNDFYTALEILGVMEEDLGDVYEDT